MRILPIITAIVAVAILYFVVLERDKLLSFAGVETSTDVSDGDIPTEDTDISEPTINDDGVMKVVVLQSKAQSLASGILLTGETNAARQVEVRAETTSSVISAPFAKGDTVSTGDVLCSLDVGTRQAALAETKARFEQALRATPEAAAAIIEAQARVDEAKINLNTTRELRRNGYASTQQLASAEAAWETAASGLERARSGDVTASASIESAQAAVQAAELELARTDISAPFDGLIDSDTAEVGSLLQAGSVCATVIQLDPIKVVGFVNEVDVNRIDIGANARAELIDETVVIGTVEFVSRSADPLTRTFRVEINAPNTDLRIRAGQTAKIAIQAAGSQSHLVPQSALTLSNDGELGLRLVNDDNLVTFAPIEIVNDTVDGVWVNGLPEAANIIVIGQEYVISGVKVEPSFREKYP